MGQGFSYPTGVAGCTCDLEPSFGVVSKHDSGLEGEKGFIVYDAECEEIAECDDQRFADLIAWALNKLSDNDRLEVCRLHSEKK